MRILLLMLFIGACADSVPVATQYKQQSLGGQSQAPANQTQPVAEEQESQDATGGAIPEDAAPPSDDQGSEMLAAQGQSVFQQSGCANAGCHDNAAADPRITTVNSAQLILDAASLPVHGGVAAWPAAAEADQLFEYFKSLAQG